MRQRIYVIPFISMAIYLGAIQQDRDVKIMENGINAVKYSAFIIIVNVMDIYCIINETDEGVKGTDEGSTRFNVD